MSCKRNGDDKLLKALVAKGINVILPPRTGIAPGDLVVGDPGGTIRRSDWKVVLGIAVGADAKAESSFKSVTFDVSDSLGVAAGVSLLGRILAAFGLGEGALSAAVKSAGATSLNVALIAPAVLQLQNFDEMLQALRDNSAKPAPDYADRRLFVVERAWRAKGLSLELRNSSGASVALSAEAVDKLKAAAKLEFEDANDGRISFLAETRMIFGLTFRELVFLDGRITDRPSDRVLTFRGAAPAEAAFAAEDELLIELFDS